MKKHIVSVSGGVGSYFTLKRVLEKNNKENVIAVFMDTLAEDGDLYRFLDDIEKKLDIKIIRLCVGKTPLELAFERKYLWNSRVAECSIRLKSKPFREWLKETYKPSECILYLGIYWTETHRKDESTYKITENGFYYRTSLSINWFTESANTIESLLNGNVKAVPKPWKPKKGEAYWHYSKGWEQATFRKWEGAIDDFCTWKCGNCFRTEEEANTKGKEIMEKLVKEYEEA